MQFLKKNYGNLVLVLIIVLLLIPQTRLHIQVFLQRLISGTPKVISESERKSLSDYSWQLRSPDGKSVDFSISKNKVAIVNFWATWCPPCIAEMPSLQNLYNEYGDKVDFYFVSNEKPETLIKFLQVRNYSLPVYIEQSSAPAILQSETLPTTFVISKTGKIIIRKAGAAKWNSNSVHQHLEQLLAE
ncbi:MAG: TlpA family protein disulfide reductase [Sphingobacteriales bacterium]|nr:TlpA family protein disulfide reductase [Sphingobacteriales bacterium]